MPNHRKKRKQSKKGNNFNKNATNSQSANNPNSVETSKTIKNKDSQICHCNDSTFSRKSWKNIVVRILASTLSIVTLVIAVLTYKETRTATNYARMTSPLNFSFKYTNDAIKDSDNPSLALSVDGYIEKDGYDGMSATFVKTDAKLCGDLYEMFISTKYNNSLETARCTIDDKSHSTYSLHNNRFEILIDNLSNTGCTFTVYKKSETPKRPAVFYITFKGYADNLQQFIFLIDENNQELERGFLMTDANEITNFNDIGQHFASSVINSALKDEYGLSHPDSVNSDATPTQIISYRNWDTLIRLLFHDLDEVATLARR